MPEPHELEGPDALKARTKFIAIVIRNAMEDFHSAQLTDEQMKQPNPIIRNAVYTALHAMSHRKEGNSADRYVKHHVQMIPDYWEEPEYLGGYNEIKERDAGAKSRRGERVSTLVGGRRHTLPSLQERRQKAGPQT